MLQKGQSLGEGCCFRGWIDLIKRTSSTASLKNWCETVFSPCLSRFPVSFTRCLLVWQRQVQVGLVEVESRLVLGPPYCGLSSPHPHHPLILNTLSYYGGACVDPSGVFLPFFAWR